MKKFIMVLVVLCSMMITSVAMAMTQEQLDERRAYAEKKISQAEEVTYDQLMENEKYYTKRFVKITGICRVSQDNLALLGDDKEKMTAIQVMTYRFKPDVEYTVYGQFAGMMKTVEGTKWAVIVEDTHLPFMSEYGL